jgi:intein-encoded DNA endonuclease-like protein
MDIQNIIKLSKQGFSQMDISKKMNCSQAYISKLLRKHGIDSTSRKYRRHNICQMSFCPTFRNTFKSITGT